MKTMYRVDEIVTRTNLKETELSILLRSNGKLLWSGTSKHAAEAWLREHLIPPTMPKDKLASLVEDAFKPRR